MPKAKKRKTTALKSKPKSRLKFNFQQSWASIFIGAIVVVILGLLVANLLTKNTGQVDDGAVKTDQASNSTEAIANQGGKHKVAIGDSLSAISMKYYGTFDYWPALAKANNIANPNLIDVDANLVIPSKIEAQKLVGDLAVTSYDVVSGDTLFDIAQKVYGDGSQWRKIAIANKVGYLPNGNPLIFSGNKLTIPR